MIHQTKICSVIFKGDITLFCSGCMMYDQLHILQKHVFFFQYMHYALQLLINPEQKVL